MVNSLTAWARKYRYLLLLAITAVGAFLRLYQIDSLPPGDGYDVAQYGLDALQILDGARPIFLAANFGREVLFSYLVAFVYLFSGPGATGIHLSSALIGIATIPAIYWACRELLESEAEALQVWGPLLAASVTAVAYWHLNFSRAGLRVIWVPLFAALIVGALWRGLGRGGRAWFVLTGLLLGLSQYTYQAARLLPLLVLAGFLFTYFSRRSFTRRDLVDMLLTFGLALLIFAPLGLFAINQPQVFNDRLRQTALLNETADLGEQAVAVGEQALITLRMFFIEGDNEPLYTIPGRPSLNPFLAVAFIAGILVSLWHWKRPNYLYLLAWLLLLTAPAMIADQAATAKRALGAFPAAAILISIGLLFPAQLLARGKKWPGALYAALIALGLLWTGVVTFNDYFYRWGEDPALAAHFERDHSEIGLAAAAVPGEAVLISPFPASHPSIQLNSGRHDDLRSYNGHQCLIVPDRQGGPVHYFIVPGETENSLEHLQTLYPNGTVEEGPQRPDRDEPYYTSFVVSQTAAVQAEDHEALILNWQDKIGLLDFAVSPQSASPGETVAVTLTYHVLEEMDSNYTAFVHLLGKRDGNAGPLMITQTDSEPCAGALRTGTWREGDTIRDTVHLAIPKNTPPGSYHLATGFYTWPDITPLAAVGQDQELLTTLEIK